MKKILLIILILFLITISNATAHPGRTDSSGCHTCRTNCPSWGLSYGEYHCHNGGSAPTQQAQPTSVPIKINTPTPNKVINTPTNMPVQLTTTPYPTNTLSPTMIPNPTDTPSPISNLQNTTQEVAGESTSADNNVGLITLALIAISGVVGGIYFKNRKT